MSGDDSQTSLQARTRAFLQDFFIHGQELVRELIEENEALRRRLAEGVEASGEREMVERLTRQIEQLEAECSEIRRMAGSMQRETGGYRARLTELEQEHYQLAGMYVASSQLHAAATLDEVVRTTTEILLNFVGVGEFVLWCVDEARQVLFPLHREGGSAADCAEIPLPAEGSLGEVLRGGVPWSASAPRDPAAGTLLFVPLWSARRLVGVAQLLAFLPQKQQFADTDFALLEMVSAQCGVGLETAWIRSQAGSAPMVRQSLEELVLA